MIRGLYTSGWGMMSLNKKLDVISNNMANAATTAYKKDTVIYETFPEVLVKRLNDTRSRLNPTGNTGTMELGSDVGEVYTYFTQGPIENTGNSFNFAFKNSPSAFFTVIAPDNQEREYYTRDGSFMINSEGELTNKEGYLVAGENGPILLDAGTEFYIAQDGSVVQFGEAIDRLLIREFEDTSTLRKIGSNLVQATAGSMEREFSGEVVQGFLEQSNVDIVREMVDMITVMRSYEANQKILQFQDGTLEKAVNEVGALR